MIFFKKQHEDIAAGFLKRVDFLLRSDNKAVAGYSIDAGVETLKLKIGKSLVTMTIEGEMWSHRQDELPKVEMPTATEPALDGTKELIY